MCAGECSSDCRVRYAAHSRMEPMNKQHRCHLENVQKGEKMTGRPDEGKMGQKERRGSDERGEEGE